MLGRRNKGVPKTLTQEQRKAQAERFRRIAMKYNARLKAGLVERRVRGPAKAN